MAEDQGKEEEKFDFTTEGEVIGYISLDQARLRAIQMAGEVTGEYGRRYRNVAMAFEAVEAIEAEDSYTITLSFRPQGDFAGTPGQEQFFVEKEGRITVRQVLSLPKLTEGQRFRPLPVTLGLVAVGAIVAIVAMFALGRTSNEGAFVGALTGAAAGVTTDNPEDSSPTIIMPSATAKPTNPQFPTPSRGSAYTPSPFPSSETYATTPSATRQGCYERRSSKDSLESIAVDPTPGTSLQAGTAVEFKAKVLYYLDSEVRAEMVLMYQNPDGGRLSFGESVEVSNGTGAITLLGTLLDVPEQPDLEVRAHLFPAESVYRAAGFDCYQPTLDKLVAVYPIIAPTPRPTPEGSASSYFKKGEGYNHDGKYRLAVEEFTTAIRLNPGYTSAYWARGWAYDYLNQYQQAIQDFDKAIQLDPYDSLLLAMAYQGRSEAYDRLGNHGIAGADNAKACSLDSQYC